MKKEIGIIPKNIFLVFLLGILFSCTNDMNPSVVTNENTISGVSTIVSSTDKDTASNIDKEKELILRPGLMDVQRLNDNILVQLKYSGTENFTGEQLYFKIKRAYLQKEVADKLCKAQTILDDLKPGYHLMVYDAIRPREVQHKMWEALDSIPRSVRINFVSNPRKGSIHNYGAAVDVTITNEKLEMLDMGAEYDDPRKIAYPIHEKRFLNTGELLLEHIDNRKLLRLVMGKAGFTGIDSEWWHFNACSHQYAQSHYPIIEKEEDIFR